MRVKLLRDAEGAAYAADITLTKLERSILHWREVKMIYGEGCGPRDPDARGVVRFGGPLFWDVERRFLADLDAFKAAMAAAVAARTERKANAEARQRGFEDFPAGRWMDAQRGTKSYPNHARCPYRVPARVAAWEAGYAEAHDAVVEGR